MRPADVALERAVDRHSPRKRVALCLSGLVGATAKFGWGKTIDYALAYESFRRNVFDESVDVDVFIHSWGVDHRDALTALYAPRSAAFETQINFGSHLTPRQFAAFSKAYSSKQVMALKRRYEDEQGFEYDWVILTRLDIYIDKKLDYDVVDNRYFYLNGPMQPHGTKCRCWFCDSANPNHCVDDLVFFSNSRDMDLLVTLFDSLEQYAVTSNWSNHIIIRKHLQKTRLWDRVNFYFKTIPNKYAHIWLLLRVPAPKRTDTPLIRDKYKKWYLKLLDAFIVATKLDVVYCYAAVGLRRALSGWLIGSRGTGP